MIARRALLQDVRAPPGAYDDFTETMLGSRDINALIGYEVMMDDGLGGPFYRACDGRAPGRAKQRMLTCEVHELFPGRTYRAFVRALGWTGPSDASNMVSYLMALPPPAPRDVQGNTCGSRCIRLNWKTTETLMPLLYFVCERGLEDRVGQPEEFPNFQGYLPCKGDGLSDEGRM